MRQKFEIEVDVPDGWRIKCQGTRNDIRPVLTPNSCTTQIVANIILEKVEPKRESRWRLLPTLHSSPSYSYLYPTLADARRAIGCNHNGEFLRMERLDYENGKLVAVTLEPEGEP